MNGPCQRPECGGKVHTDHWGNPVRCPAAPDTILCPRVHQTAHDAHDYEGLRCPGWMPDDGTRPEPPTENDLNTVLPIRPDPRQPAYDAVYEYLRALGPYLPPDPVHRNAVIWRAVHAAINATPVGCCVSSHCVEGGHILPIEGEAS